MSTICGHAIEEYLKMVEEFHGFRAPGVLIGGFMVDHAMKNRPAGEFFDAICETSVCLPDAVQLLTPCTYGNGWLRVVNVGRFALALFEKRGGEGVRVHLDAARLDAFPEINNWFLRLTPKREQDGEALIRQIIEAGSSILGMRPVKVDACFLVKEKGGAIAICPGCGEAYPADAGKSCHACQGAPLYR